MIPRSPSGGLTTVQLPLYKCPPGFWALVVGWSFTVTGGTDRVVGVYVREPSATARRIRKASIEATPTPSALVSHISLGPDRLILTEGMTIEAEQDTGTDVDWHLSILERPL